MRQRRANDNHSPLAGSTISSDTSVTRRFQRSASPSIAAVRGADVVCNPGAELGLDTLDGIGALENPVVERRRPQTGSTDDGPTIPGDGHVG